jgi:RNA polymerase II subunit A C-terminal domain phosphatase
LTPSETGLNAGDENLQPRSPLSKRKKLVKDRQNASKLKESISPEEIEFVQPLLLTVASPGGEDKDEEEDGESMFDDDDEDDFLARELEEEMG